MSRRKNFARTRWLSLRRSLSSRQRRHRDKVQVLHLGLLISQTRDKLLVHLPEGQLHPFRWRGRHTIVIHAIAVVIFATEVAPLIVTAIMVQITHNRDFNILEARRGNVITTAIGTLVVIVALIRAKVITIVVTRDQVVTTTIVHAATVVQTITRVHAETNLLSLTSTAKTSRPNPSDRETKKGPTGKTAATSTT